MYNDKPIVVFIFNLLQDVTVFWRLAMLVSEKTSFSIEFLVTENFMNKDADERWQSEIAELELRVSARVERCHQPSDIYDILKGRRGVIFSASESSLNPHRFAHEMFRKAPVGFVRVTLQHGFECSGFRQNREQSLAFSNNVEFAADIICSWTGPEKLTHTHLSDLAKVVVTGPTSRIRNDQLLTLDEGEGSKIGLVCENLHSTRMNTVADFRSGFMETLMGFGRFMVKRGNKVAVRPHPGGQYVVKNAVALPDGMELHNQPMYRLDLSQYAYGISAPSSVLIDMVLAGIPTAVWQDSDHLIDTSAYEGLTKISTLGDWIAFANAAITNPAPFLEQQERFIAESGLVIDPQRVEDNYLSLVRGLCGNGPGILSESECKRVLFVANGDIPTLQICFMKPLSGLFQSGVLNPLLVTEAQLQKAMGSSQDRMRGLAWFEKTINEHKPDVAVLCRYSGPLTENMIQLLQDKAIPVIYHIDDDLMNVPRELGEAKFKEHNSPERVLSVASGLTDADIVYCSTPALQDRLETLGFTERLRTGPFHCAGEVLAQSSLMPVKTIGYMGFDHAHDLAMITPSLLKVLDKYQNIRFELFGTIPVPPEFERFGDRISSHLPVRPYDAFLEHLTRLQWDIGLCPLADTAFNRYKANNKWVEYTSTGAAVIATAGMAYDQCCGDDCGLLVSNPEGWFEAIDKLCSNPSLRLSLVENAQRRLREDYSAESLRNQILEVFDEANEIRKMACNGEAVCVHSGS